MTDPAAFIRAHLPIIPVPGLPEIRLHRAQPSSRVGRLAGAGAAAGSPYWAYFWPGGLALALYLRDRPQRVVGRRVLDLGAGSGLVGIAAARAGAREIIAAETDPNALAALRLNAEANGIDLTIVTDDLTTGAPPPVDVILVGDLFYDREVAGQVTAFLDRAAECDVLIGDPGRPYLPMSRLQRLAEYDVTEVGGSPAGPGIRSAVYAFGPRTPKPLEMNG